MHRQLSTSAERLEAVNSLFLTSKIEACNIFQDLCRSESEDKDVVHLCHLRSEDRDAHRHCRFRQDDEDVIYHSFVMKDKVSAKSRLKR